MTIPAMQGIHVMAAQQISVQLAATADLPKRNSKGFCVFCNKLHKTSDWKSAAVEVKNNDGDSTIWLLAGGRPVISGIAPAVTQRLNCLLQDVKAR